MGREAIGIADRIPDWQLDAECRWEPGARFFPTTGDNARDMADDLFRVLCSTCPVMVECLAFAMDQGEYGIWAGTTEEDRRKLGRIKTRTKCPVCKGADPAVDTAVNRRLGGRVRVVQLCRYCGHSWYAETNTTTELEGTAADRRRIREAAIRARKAGERVAS